MLDCCSKVRPECLVLRSAARLAGISAFVVMLTLSVLNFLLFYAGGEFIYLFLSIEENTRRVAYLSQQQYVAQQTPYVTPPPAPQDYED